MNYYIKRCSYIMGFIVNIAIFLERRSLNMKKILATLLALLMVLSLAACSSNPADTNNTNNGVVSVEETDNNKEQSTSGVVFNWVECENAEEMYDATGFEVARMLGDMATYRYTEHNETEKLTEASYKDVNTGLVWQIREYRGAFGQYLTREQASSETGEALPFAEDNCGQPASVTLPGAENASDTLYRALEDGTYQFVMITKNDTGWYLWMTVLEEPSFPELPL